MKDSTFAAQPFEGLVVVTPRNGQFTKQEGLREFKAEFLQLIRDKDYEAVVLDVRRVASLSPAVFAVWDEVQEVLKQSNGKLMLVGGEQVSNMLQAAGQANSFNIAPSVSQAISNLTPDDAPPEVAQGTPDKGATLHGVHKLKAPVPSPVD